jgi:hypothetical protein
MKKIVSLHTVKTPHCNLEKGRIYQELSKVQCECCNEPSILVSKEELAETDVNITCNKGNTILLVRSGQPVSWWHPRIFCPVDKLKEKEQEAAKLEKYEEAAEYRDLLMSIDLMEA